MTMTDIKSMTQEEITDALRAMGEPAFRGKQVFSWLHNGATDFAEMNNLSKPLREKLGKEFTITAPTVARKQVSRLDGTVKYLWELRDCNCIETGLMSYHHCYTVCISSQVGCRMGCKFCASTIAGKVRDLTPSEMLDQVLFTQLDSGKDISNIVLMGIGEPLDNRANVLRFLQLVNHPEGLNIGMRHISLSTCGVVPGIDALAEETLQLTLSVSLHAPDSATRSRIMPVNNAYDVEELFAACHRYFKKTGRRISFEYAMIDGVNDHDWQADLLAELEDAIFTYREIFSREGIELRYECADDLPPIIADGERMKQVFCNVLDNAAKHGGSGKRIDVSVAAENGSMVIRVRDFGPGIPVEELPYVKQKFYKGSSKARGSGIGLAVCDEIMRLHNGTFDIANASGGGAVVTMTLPMEK